MHAGGQEFESPILHHFRRAFSSVGRASPLQGEGQKFESSNAHHKRDDDICYHLFYFVQVKSQAQNDKMLKKTDFKSVFLFVNI